MNDKVTNALARLQKILPLKSRRDGLDLKSSQLYQSILNMFYSHGRAPTLLELCSQNDDALNIISRLAELDMITLDDRGEIKGCYPFTMEKRAHRIELNGFEVHAMCALDALAPSAMYECHSRVWSECAVTSQQLLIELNQQDVVNFDQAKGIYFGLNWVAAAGCGSCSDHLCTEMLFFCDRDVANGWLQQDPQSREIFTLEQSIQFSAGFFVPMMQRV